MRRADLKALSRTRLQDAALLLAGGRYAASYYLLGYSVECAIKARIAKQFKADSIPDRTLVNSIYQHDLEKLVRVAGLDADLMDRRRQNPEFDAKWTLVRDWRPEMRYSMHILRRDAQDMHDAVTDPTHGVLQWLHRH
jgi:hypothetical protein